MMKFFITCWFTIEYFSSRAGKDFFCRPAPRPALTFYVRHPPGSDNYCQGWPGWPGIALFSHLFAAPCGCRPTRSAQNTTHPEPPPTGPFSPAHPCCLHRVLANARTTAGAVPQPVSPPSPMPVATTIARGFPGDIFCHSPRGRCLARRTLLRGTMPTPPPHHPSPRRTARGRPPPHRPSAGGTIVVRTARPTEQQPVTHGRG